MLSHPPRLSDRCAGAASNLRRKSSWGEVGLTFHVVHWLRPFLIAASLFFIPSSFASSKAVAQEVSASSALPDAPEPSQTTTASQLNDSQQTGAGILSGTVVDSNGDVLVGARVTLADASGSVVRTVDSGSDGQFVFSGLPANVYTLSVSAPGMSSFTSPQIALHSGEDRIVPTVGLAVSGGMTSVTVNGSRKELSEQQERIAVQQRIGGVIPNFYSAYDWNAPPMLAKQKFQVSIRSIIDPVSFLSVAGLAGAEQYQNLFPAYGSGFVGYAKRYGAAMANHVSGDLLGRAVFPSIFHQDPRYFYKGKGSIRSRALYAVSAAVIARGDNGRWEPNYSRVLGNFSAAATSNLYYPAADRGSTLILTNGLGGIGVDAVANLIREFVLKGITSHVPKDVTAEP